MSHRPRHWATVDAPRAAFNADRAAANDERRAAILRVIRHSGPMRQQDIADVLDEPPDVVSGAVAHLWRQGTVSIDGTDPLAVVEAVR